jgi:hypothetical protein
MPYSHAILFDLVLRGLYDSVGLWNKCNRAYDKFMGNNQGTSAHIPKNPQLVVLDEGSAVDSADRKAAIADTDMVDVPFKILTLPMLQEIEDQILLGNMNINNFIMDADAAFSNKADALVLAEAASGAHADNKLDSKTDVISYEDITMIDQRFNILNIPQNQRIIVVPAARTQEFKNLDIVKQAMAFNKELLTGGVSVIDNKQFYISSVAPKVAGKDALYGLSTQQMVVVLKGYMERKEVYSTVTRKTAVDYNSGLAVKLARSEGAVIIKMKAAA